VELADVSLSAASNIRRPDKWAFIIATDSEQVFMATTKVGIAAMKAAQVPEPGGDFEIVSRQR
jgi:hypothetical protein